VWEFSSPEPLYLFSHRRATFGRKNGTTWTDLFAAAIGTGFYYWFASMIERQSMQDYIRSHFWLLHPNSICYWRTAMALVGYVLYFHTSYQATAIIIFTFAAILDGSTGWWRGDEPRHQVG